MSPNKSISPATVWLVWSAVALFVVFQSASQTLFAQIEAGMTASLRLTEAQSSLLASVLPLMIALWMLPVGVLLDRLNTKWVVTLALLSMSVGMFVLAAAPSALVAGLAFILIGSGSAFAFVSAGLICRLWFSAALFAFAFGLVNFAASVLGGAVIPTGLAALESVMDWRTITALVGSVGLAICLFNLAVTRRPASDAATETKPVSESPWRSLSIVLGTPQVWACGFLEGALLGTVFGFGMLWDITYQKKVWGHDLYTANQINSFILIGYGVGTPLWGWLSDRIGLRKRPVQIASFIAFAALTGALWGGWPLWAVSIAFAIFGLSAGAAMLNYPLVCENTPPRVHSLAMAFVNMSGFISVTLLIQAPTWILAALGSASPENIHLALGIFPAVIFLGAVLNSTFFIRETNCRSRFAPLSGPLSDSPVGQGAKC